MSLEKLREKRRKWVEANRENGFDVGIKRLLTELYPDNAHFIYELLQNAEDARAKEVRFILSEDRIEFEHNGDKLFLMENVEAITSIGFSTKRDESTSIGKFGVGFKAVFSYTSAPEIESGKFHFRIDDMVIPESLCNENKQIEQELTRFIFPLNNPKKTPDRARSEIERLLNALNSATVLFLTHISKVEYLLPDSSLGYIERIDHGSNRFEIRVQHPNEPNPSSAWFLKFDKEVQIEDEEDNKLKNCRISVAFGLKLDDEKPSTTKKKDGAKNSPQQKIIPMEPGQVCIYFPAEKETSNLRFHLHAPFASTVARDSVRDCEANNLLRNNLADLTAESLTAIRDQGFLTVGFFAVLPNPLDSLPVFYEPIRAAVVAAFKEQELVPTKSESHAPAAGLYRSPARIQEVISDADLSFLTQYDVPLWAKNPPQENQQEARFLDSLDIEDWGWDELEDAISCYSYDDEKKARIEEWVYSKDDAWLLRFYALLGEARVSHYKHLNVENLCIIRVAGNGNDQHVRPQDAFFLPEDNEASPSTDVLFVKPTVYVSGRSKNQKDLAREFLVYAGVRPFDAKASIEIILEQYVAGKQISRTTNIKHLRQFVNYWQRNPNDIHMFKKTAFLLGGDDVETTRYCKPGDLYLDAPFFGTGLDALFHDSNLVISKPKRQLARDYLGVKQISDFTIALGVMRQLEICEYKATEMQNQFSKTGRETSTTVNRDYFINGLSWHRKGSDSFVGSFDLGECKSMALSRAVWGRMCSANPKELEAEYIPNEQRKHERIVKSSFLVDYLKKKSWVPDRDGNFLRPADVTKETLHPDFKFDDRNGWLTAVGFGENVNMRTEEYQTRNRDAKKWGFDSVEEAETFKALKKEGLTVQVLQKIFLERKPVEQPKKAVSDPTRRREKGLVQAEDAPSKESVQRERTIQKGLSDVAAHAKAFLRSEYKNKDGQIICQCCHEEMPFKLSSGDHYFEAVQCITDKEKRHYKNRLALCPNCAAMYQYARETDDAELRRRIVENGADDQSPSVEIPIRLADREYTLYFVGTHFFDLETILAVGAVD